MIVERFHPGSLSKVARRFQLQGRMLPEGVAFQSSWLDYEGTRCFQVMEAPTREALDEWINAWSDIVDFEVIPVKTSQAFWSEIRIVDL